MKKFLYFIIIFVVLYFKWFYLIPTQKYNDLTEKRNLVHQARTQAETIGKKWQEIISFFKKNI